MQLAFPNKDRLCSYPTYEEWKLVRSNTSVNHTRASSSYPTYEEWKHTWRGDSDDKYSSSYPTYEEWKLKFNFWLKSIHFLVLILPMRNGNTTSLQNAVESILVLILPMRNGNRHKLELAVYRYPFLSYL